MPDEAVPLKSSSQEQLVALWTKRLTIATYVLAITSVFTVIVGAIAAAAGYLQWREIKAGSEDTHLVAEAVKAQSASIVAEDRAWIGNSGNYIAKIDKNMPVYSEVYFTNYGKKPASVSIETYTNSYSSNEVDQLIRDEAEGGFGPHCYQLKIGDTTPYGVVFPQTSNAWTNSESPKTIERVIRGDLIYVRWDCFVYTSGHEIKHTLSCYQMDLQGKQNSMKLCGYGNKAE